MFPRPKKSPGPAWFRETATQLTAKTSASGPPTNTTRNTITVVRPARLPTLMVVPVP
ncbi:hypothetical protein ACFFX0_18385 [Citricoccus parietis]|uniref:Uncharacterized protein n=1 Tax=Citricoccus parietis TaxID=592307 RepID=A0ABV5G2A7_9MICC